MKHTKNFIATLKKQLNRLKFEIETFKYHLFNQVKYVAPVDISFELGNTSRKTIEEIYTHYYSGKICPKAIKKVKEYKTSPAAIINLCSLCKTGDEFIQKLLKL